jgi:hypothetical protein
MNLNTAALVTLKAQGAGTITSGDIPNPSFAGGVFGVNLATVTSASVVVTIEGKDAASGTYYAILASAALASAGFTALTIYPGVVVSATQANAVLPATYRVSVTITGGSAAVTGTIGASLIG